MNTSTNITAKTREDAEKNCIFALNLDRALGKGVGIEVGRLSESRRYFRIESRCEQTRMAQQRLDNADVGPVFEKVCCHRVAQGMRRNGPGKATFLADVLKHPVYGTGCKPFPFCIQKDGLLVFLLLDAALVAVSPRIVQISYEISMSNARHRHSPFFAPFSEYGDPSVGTDIFPV